MRKVLYCVLCCCIAVEAVHCLAGGAEFLRIFLFCFAVAMQSKLCIGLAQEVVLAMLVGV